MGYKIRPQPFHREGPPLRRPLTSNVRRRNTLHLTLYRHTAPLFGRTMHTCRLWILAFATAVSGCATVHESVPPPTGSAPPVALSVSVDNLPKDDFLPEQSVVAPGTKYVVVQSGGGSILLGPILGSMNIAANTKAMAEQYKDSVLSIDPTPFTLAALARVGIPSSTAPSAFSVKPFVFAQHCYDGQFRLSLVFHVDSQSKQWLGRYTYHLPTSYQVSQFGSLSNDEISKYQSELANGAEILAGLLKRDLSGDLPTSGKPVKFGSLYLIGNKIGGMGIYTMPEELFFPNAQLIEETDAYVTIRLKGNMHATGLFGGMAFGVHRIDKKLVHTLKPI
jgi:hypothetical protein